MDKLKFEFMMKQSGDPKTNVLCITSIMDAEKNEFIIPEQLQPVKLHDVLMKTQVFLKIKTTLQRRHEKRQVWISLTQDLRDTYMDEDGNMQFRGYLLEQATQKTQERDSTSEMSTEALTKILENFAELKKESKQFNLKNLSEKFVLEKFSKKTTSVTQWMATFETECFRIGIGEDIQKIQVFRLFLDDSCQDWYNSMLIKYTIDSEWCIWKTSFCETYASKGWTPISTNNNGEARGRARGARGTRSRGSLAARSSVRRVRTRGGQGGGSRLSDRPSVSEPLLMPSLAARSGVRRVRTRGGQGGGSRLFDRPSVSEPYVECGESSRTNAPKTKRPVPSVGDSAAKRRRCLIASSSDVKPLNDYEISVIFNYGSEEEPDEEEDDTQSIVVPRVARVFMDEEDDEVQEGCFSISLEWPPPPPHPSVCAPMPALPTAVSPTLALPTPVPLTPMEPADKFLFNWRAFSTSQIEPQLRREPFSQINSGPTVSFANPYEAFTAIWDREIMELIVTETNIYAQQLTTSMLQNGTIYPNSRITRWQDTNVNELYTYLAIVLAMGVVVKSRLDEYWNISKDIFNTPGFSTEMRYDRFQLLSKCLHFNNNVNCNPALLTQPQAKLFKLQPILDHLNGKFSQLYNLSQNVALDESLTMWKGRLDINQFIPNKAATIGIKTYEVCESQTGYMWRFEVHAGHETSETSAVQENGPLSGKVPSLVLRLLNGIEHKGHTVWMDNFYNSPALARELKVLGFDCVGTLRTNRQFVPSDLASITTTDMTVGQVFGCTSGDVDLMVWRDKKRVAFISTYHGLATARCGDTLKPTVVLDYNICMGGVDRKDQILAMYPVERMRTRVWYKKFFRRLLNVSVLNAHILLQNKLLTHRKFRKVLITDLLTAHRTSAPPTPITLTTTIHSPAQYDVIKLGKPDRLKRKCAVCRKRTVTYCKACQVAMCIFTCYEPYHTSH